MASNREQQAILQDVHDETNSALKVQLASNPTISIGEVDQGAKGDAVSDAWYVQGTAADGAAVPAEAPVLIAGQDGTNVQTLLTNTAGALLDPTFATVDSGEFAPGVTAAQFPTISCRWVRIKARAQNTGKVCIGPAGVTLSGGSTSATVGLQLSAGEDTGWIPVANLNVFYGIGTGAGDSVTYMTLA